MSKWKRRKHVQYIAHRIIDVLGFDDQTLKTLPAYDALCRDGLIAS